MVITHPLRMKLQKTYFMVTLILIIFVLSVIAVINTYNKNIDLISLEKKIEKIRIDNSIPSIQASIISNNELIWTGQFGSGEKNSSYMIGSVQKVFTSTAILQLVEKRLIDSLDDNINDYLPFKIENSKSKEKSITFKLLLGHRSGLTNELPYQFFWDTEAIAYPNYRTDYNEKVLSMTTEEYLHETLHENGSLYNSDNWIAPPNSRYFYSPSGYVLLKFLIEKITNSSIEKYMQKNIFLPLGLQNTGFQPINQVQPFTVRAGKIEELPIWTGKYMVRSTSSDMAKFMLALMNGGEYGGQRILQKNSLEQIKSSYPNWSKSENLELFDLENFQLKSHGYGLGWDRYSVGINGHGGSVPGFQTYFLCKEGILSKNGIILMMNANTLLGYRSDNDHIFSQFAKIRNLLLIKAGMISPASLGISILASVGNVVWLVLVLNVINLVVWKERNFYKLKKTFMYKLIYYLSCLLNLFVGLVTINEKNNALELIGISILVLAFFLLILPIRELRKYGNCEKSKSYVNTRKIVEKGIYKYIRHPQYIGLILFNLALMLIIQIKFVNILSIIGIVCVILLVYEEEKELISLFGDNFIRYREKTWF